MTYRSIVPIAVVCALIGAGALFSVVFAQQPRLIAPMNQMGRFTVAHASDKQIIILDTTSGRLYKATPEDYQKYSELNGLREEERREFNERQERERREFKKQQERKEREERGEKPD